MSKVSASFFISLDGVVEAPENWNPPYFSDEMGAVIGQAIASTGAFLLGRRTYQEWAAFWPQQDPGQLPMAHAINTLPKYVVSGSLDDAEWQNSTVLKGDLSDEVTKLKQQTDKDIAINGSATLVRSLLEAGLLDELRLMVHPVILGSGARLFETSTPNVPLELVESQTFTTGVLNLTYRPAGG
jgi:dihydrofolate reductase